ncbi:hypothetical protein COX85_02635 [Candidatus Micrarchaeota archaeon CG_4_10_14_0_2_um_filter_55_9]|nr:MAG: hypothetical protein AUJ15_01685 [Candidatus Micrarchaeota archaeon CG1_02_55_41]PIO02791.1 MAG: hypothetical protein COT57_02260 [Candidatus Micrarchaeota archaeon CG09_land_8_20_14_0_10_55_25]PIZ91672.1 MAG: hypothetical protein COX85_02635 [Candidatus Micrarchaeota archaeon CG_4_10_14_0_2_um_filter_55_9]
MATLKKTVDNWKKKKWYRVISPKFLGEKELAQVPALDEDHILNRVIILPLREITRDLRHTYTNVCMRVYEVKGDLAYTKFIRHEVSRDYLATQIRRRRTALQMAFPVKSRDGVEFRIKMFVITAVRCSAKQKNTLRVNVQKFVEELVSKRNFGDFILDVLYGKVNEEVKDYAGNLVVPVHRVEVYKTELKEEFDTEEVREVVELKESSPKPRSKTEKQEPEGGGEEAPSEEAVDEEFPEEVEEKYEPAKD